MDVCCFNGIEEIKIFVIIKVELIIGVVGDFYLRRRLWRK